MCLSPESATEAANTEADGGRKELVQRGARVGGIRLLGQQEPKLGPFVFPQIRVRCDPGGRYVACCRTSRVQNSDKSSRIELITKNGPESREQQRRTTTFTPKLRRTGIGSEQPGAEPSGWE
ncbi:hypothetical protein L596_002233 [Steinernema carpocapsae]|uniref:Uncharacterized protein n=1 Tax=Steinernema carpocapsae TaxID=34508 RepID=A0A4U8UNZ8_STECR|nr:hypothetical protein L596_002233 [Steinernema carpocapsae]